MNIKRLEKEEIFKFLRPDQINIISNAADTIKYQNGDIIYYRGAKPNYFFIVLSGHVTLRLPGKKGISILIDTLDAGAMFGSCISFEMNTYTLDAQCISEAEILRIKSSTLKQLMDDEPQMGYAIQSQISQIYFKRYVEIMKKLQSIVMNIPVDTV